MHKHPYETTFDELPRESSRLLLALAGLSLLTVIGAGTVISWIIEFFS
ncbi:hypothetical protein [Hymenobacter sp. GOD-10R]|nr:hypothetical protein [Hymenobacter sp. GOD-10R]WRQ26707.1 hypothetical protein SD425_16665 [Hymenobacter sp. GOD-10R]